MISTTAVHLVGLMCYSMLYICHTKEVTNILMTHMSEIGHNFTVFLVAVSTYWIIIIILIFFV